MGLRQYFFWALLLISCGYALWRGRSEERIIGTVCLTAAVTTLFVIPPIKFLYQHVESGLLVIDLAVLAIFIAVALRSPRFWPLWVAGLQLTSSTAHVMTAIDTTLLPRAYGAAIVLWSYPILFILIFGTWRGQRKTRAERRLGAPG